MINKIHQYQRNRRNDVSLIHVQWFKKMNHRQQIFNKTILRKSLKLECMNKIYNVDFIFICEKKIWKDTFFQERYLKFFLKERKTSFFERNSSIVKTFFQWGKNIFSKDIFIFGFLKEVNKFFFERNSNVVKTFLKTLFSDF